MLAQQNTLLWEVKHPETEQKSYVFGTIHLIPESYFSFSDSLQYCIENAEEIYFEIDMDEISNISNWSGIISQLLMPDTVLLSQLTSQQEFDIISQKMNEAGIPLFMFNKLKPMFLTMLLESYETPNNSSDSSQAMMSYEYEINRVASEFNKPVNGLETMDFQISFIDSIPLDDQVQFLISVIDNDNTEISNVDLFEIYESQNLEQLDSLIFADNDYSDYNYLFLDKRNKKWIEQILINSRQKTSLYAVGAGHLPGENGILNLLKNEGFTVRPMQNK
jgi:uncharacterized protein YbaP (TraB family)